MGRRRVRIGRSCADRPIECIMPILDGGRKNRNRHEKPRQRHQQCKKHKVGKRHGGGTRGGVHIRGGRPGGDKGEKGSENQRVKKKELSVVKKQAEGGNKPGTMPWKGPTDQKRGGTQNAMVRRRAARELILQPPKPKKGSKQGKGKGKSRTKRKII